MKSLLKMTVLSGHLKRCDHGTDQNTEIRQVENDPAQRRKRNIQAEIIDHIAMFHPVIGIAECAAEQQGKAARAGKAGEDSGHGVSVGFVGRMVEFCGSLRESGVIASTAEKAASLRSAASPLVQRSSGAAAWAVLTVAQASMHRPHCVQENIQRFRRKNSLRFRTGDANLMLQVFDRDGRFEGFEPAADSQALGQWFELGGGE